MTSPDKAHLQTSPLQSEAFETERLRRQKQRNYAILALLIGWIALVVAITVVKVGKGL